MKKLKTAASSLFLTSLLTKRLNQLEKQTSTQSSFKYVVDLNELLKTGQIASSENFEREVEMLENALAVGDRNGTIIVDRNAVKRIPVVQNLAAQLASEAVAPNLRGKRIVKIDLPAIFTDSKNNAEVVARLDAALKRIEATGGKTILFVEDISGFGKYNCAFGKAVAERIRLSITGGRIQIISASTDEKFNTQIRLDDQLNSRFRKVDLDLMTEVADDESGDDKLSPDLRELVTSGEPNERVKIILQSDDIKNQTLTPIAGEKRREHSSRSGKSEYARRRIAFESRRSRRQSARRDAPFARQGSKNARTY
jgi:hypothetical protein